MAGVKKSGTLMTQGNITKQLLLFALPLLVGNLFQQFYNTVDSMVVGNFVSTQALAAVGSTNVIINTIIGFFTGLSTGAGVVISQFYGAQNDKGVHDAVHTTVLAVFLMGLVFSGIGVAITPAMLKLMATPDDVLADASLYLRIYFSGAVTVIMYNMGAGILRAIGDSKRPLYFLIMSASLNIVFDLAFVIWFHMGIAGVAIATVLAQGISALCILISLSRSDGSYKLIWRDLSVDVHLLKRIFSVGLPAAVQMMITSFSNVFVQSYINNFGSSCMAGWSSYSKLDQFIMLPMQAIALSSTTFVGQNVGARDVDRAEKGTKVSIRLAVGFTAALIVVLCVWARPLLMLFTQQSDVLDFGVLFIRTNTPFMWMCCFNQVYAGALRGSGDAKAPMVIMLSSFVVFRQIYLFAISRIFVGNVKLVSLGYPAGWLLCSASMYIYYKTCGWKQRVLAEDPESDPDIKK